MPDVSYRFGPFTLDYGTRQLLRDTDEVHLSQIGRHLLEVFQVEGSVRGATGAGLL